MEKLRGKQPCQAECQEHQTQEVKSGALTSLSKGHPEPGNMEAVVLLTRVSWVIFQKILEAVYYSHSQDCSYFRNHSLCTSHIDSISLLSLTGKQKRTKLHFSTVKPGIINFHRSFLEWLWKNTARGEELSPPNPNSGPKFTGTQSLRRGCEAGPCTSGRLRQSSAHSPSPAEAAGSALGCGS